MAPPWKFQSGPPAPPSLLTVMLADEFGAAMQSDDLAKQLRATFIGLGAITVSDFDGMFLHDVEEKLKENNLEPSAWCKQLTRYAFMPDAGAFQVLTSRNPSSLSSGSSDKTVDSEDPGTVLPFEYNKSHATVAVGGTAGWNTFDFNPETRLRLVQCLSVGKIDDTGAMHLVFKFGLLIFESRYLNLHQKTRYAMLLHKINPQISIAAWQASLQQGISNRRGGRFDKLRFHPTEMTNFIVKLETEHPQSKFAGKLIACAQEPRLFPEDILGHVTIPERVKALRSIVGSDTGQRARDARATQRLCVLLLRPARAMCVLAEPVPIATPVSVATPANAVAAPAAAAATVGKFSGTGLTQHMINSFMGTSAAAPSPPPTLAPQMPPLAPQMPPLAPQMCGLPSGDDDADAMLHLGQTWTPDDAANGAAAPVYAATRALRAPATRALRALALRQARCALTATCVLRACYAVGGAHGRRRRGRRHAARAVAQEEGPGEAGEEGRGQGEEGRGQGGRQGGR